MSMAVINSIAAHHWIVGVNVLVDLAGGNFALIV